MPAARSEPVRTYPYEPDYAVPPGETLRETIETLGLTQVDLSERSGLSTKHVNQIIQGVASITPDTAFRLEKVTGVPARVWNRLESNFQEQRLRLEERKRLAKDLEWLKTLPLKELERREMIPPGPDPTLKLQAVFRFFGVVDRQAWSKVWIHPQASFRVSKAFKVDQAALASWLRLGELEAQDIACADFDRGRFKGALEEIRTLTVRPPEEFEPRMKDLCASTGVAVVFVAEIKGARASGAARWLTPARALVQLSLRYRWEDQIWFSFFHEAGHLLLHGKRETFIDDGSDADEYEKEANRFAQEMLIPSRFSAQLQSIRTKDDVRALAEELGIAPGIIVGRMQREKWIPYDRFNDLRRRFRFSDQE
jgi:HTH-type transcriptional regulator/antitoxin HigA